MQRIGRINMPAYRIIVAEHTRGPKTGSIVEKVGTYNPKSKELVLNAERIKHWLSVGAKASGTVHNMLINAKIITGKKVNVLPKKHPPVAEKVEEKATPEAASVAETVVEEKKPADAESSGEVKEEVAAGVAAA